MLQTIAVYKRRRTAATRRAGNAASRGRGYAAQRLNLGAVAKQRSPGMNCWAATAYGEQHGHLFERGEGDSAAGAWEQAWCAHERELRTARRTCRFEGLHADDHMARAGQDHGPRGDGPKGAAC